MKLTKNLWDVAREEMPEKVQDRFWDKVRKPNANGCWLWNAATDTGGYGQFCYPRDKALLSHRVAYELLVGPIPAGLVIDHFYCQTPACVNPSHLEVVTHRANTLRGKSVPAENARKTECKNGHPFTEKNTRISSIGGRVCRECRRAYGRRYYQENYSVAAREATQ